MRSEQPYQVVFRAEGIGSRRAAALRSQKMRLRGSGSPNFDAVKKYGVAGLAKVFAIRLCL